MALTESSTSKLGWEATEFELQATDQQWYRLDDFINKKGLLILFICNHCPYAKAAWPLLIDLYEQYGNDIEFVTINSNDAEQYPEDAFEEMQKFVKENMVTFKYLWDETQEVAHDYQAQCTPDPYLFKIEADTPKLFYHGRINDNWQDPKLVTERNLEDAILNLIDGKEPPKQQPASMGCSIKWKK